ncbi:MAG: glycerol kinase [Chloroflexota bacterium]|nr:MAG: glycerol kinase [Chloroflexota bacterium]
MDRLILAIDQGTTGTTAMLFDAAGTAHGIGYREIPQIYPRPGWVSHDAEAIWQSCLVAVRAALGRAGVSGTSVAAIGITNQRETTVVWDARTGAPIAPAIVWQCRRTASACDELRSREGGAVADLIRARTGLVVDAYFSGTKIAWLLDNVDGARTRAERGELRFGTIDSWLIWKLTGGGEHVTDHSNASRTMLFDIHRATWDAELLHHLRVPETLLPSAKPSIGVFGAVSPKSAMARIVPAGTPISGVAGDQQAALFGQACDRSGMVKCTYGTGAFLLMHTGEAAVASPSGLLATLAASGPDRREYALEGSVFVAGAAIQWLRDELRMIGSAGESEAIAASVPDTAGVYLVPAFVGLGAPYWDQRARGALLGLTRGAGRAHIVRAALEAMAYQVRDVVDAMSKDSGLPVSEIRIDGGAAVNNVLAQFQADILDRPVTRPRVIETTALGASYLAGLGIGFWPDRATIARQWAKDREFLPAMAADRRESLYRGWRRAVQRSRDWDVDE